MQREGLGGGAGAPPDLNDFRPGGRAPAWEAGGKKSKKYYYNNTTNNLLIMMISLMISRWGWWGREAGGKNPKFPKNFTVTTTTAGL